MFGSVLSTGISVLLTQAFTSALQILLGFLSSVKIVFDSYLSFFAAFLEYLGWHNLITVAFSGWNMAIFC